MEGKKSFILYLTQRPTFEGLSDEDAGKLIKTVFAYVSDENPKPTGIVSYAFEIIKPILKNDLKEWDTQKLKRSEAGKKGMQSRWHSDNKPITNDNSVIECYNKDNNEYQSITSITDNVNVNVNVNDNVNVNNNKDILCVSSADNQLTNDTKQDEIDVMFEAFWKEYPRKIDKKGCLTKFKHIKKLKENYSKIMDALKIQKQSRQWQDIQYIPHPKTWLNQERWNNEELSNPNPNDKWANFKFNEI